MNDILVTIVVPIYNVEKYLDRCINSLVNQTYSNLEIILVDDGSPDNCPSMCEEWAKKDNRIKVIHKINAGLGMARNTGIENANGKYIYFVDSDDYIALDAIEMLVAVAEKEQADMVSFGFKKVNAYGDVVFESSPKTSKLVYEGKEILDYFLPNLLAHNPRTGEATNLCISAWANFYSMDLIKKLNWRFCSERDIISEDVYSLLYLCAGVSKVAVMPKMFYFYCENGCSLSNSYRNDRYKKLKTFYNECIKVCEENNYSYKVEEGIGMAFLSFVIGALKMIYTSDLDAKSKRKEASDIINDSLLQQVIHNVHINKETIKRKILFYAIKRKMVYVVELLVSARAKK